MEIHVIERNGRVPENGISSAYLKIDYWNDFSFITMFRLSLHEAEGKFSEIGDIKIGFKGQVKEISTFERLSESFGQLGEEFFSVGQGVEFYRNVAKLPNSLKHSLLMSLNDIVYRHEIISEVKDEAVFRISLLRDVSLSVIKGQYARVMVGAAELTDFKFEFCRPESAKFGGIELSFDVEVGTSPNTNIHAIIGRNGVGKTTLLNDMIEAIMRNENTYSKFSEIHLFGKKKIDDDYFSSLVSVSYSAFDPFDPPLEQPDPSKGTCYFYVGLKKSEREGSHKSLEDLRSDCLEALINCFYSESKTKRWLRAIEKLGSDENFSRMELGQLAEIYADIKSRSGPENQGTETINETYGVHASRYLKKMSSGHAIVLLTVTKLVSTVEEKTLVLMDEPESHLHPPLLSAFIRALSDLLIDRNGVAIIATHSPVVLQEIPKSCVWKLVRSGEASNAERPTIETFGENVGVLTREVFGLEVIKSGFHDFLVQSVAEGKSYGEVLHELDGQLGFEGRAILKALVHSKNLVDNAND